MGLTFQRADAQVDLDWWARNHGTGMPQNWPIFEVKCPVLFRRAWLMHLSGPITLPNLIVAFLPKIGNIQNSFTFIQESNGFDSILSCAVNVPELILNFLI